MIRKPPRTVSGRSCNRCGANQWISAGRGYLTCSPCSKERHRPGVELTREQRATNSRNYYQKHAEERRKYASNYRKDHYEETQLLRYKSNASIFEREFALTEERFRYLLAQPCSYCGRSGGGIDRQDNSKGYIECNCVPCCKICNRAKGNMPLDEFISWMHSLVAKINNLK